MRSIAIDRGELRDHPFGNKEKREGEREGERDYRSKAA